MKHTVEEIARKMDALGIWAKVSSYTFVLKPKGSVFPYFCTAILKSGPNIRARLLMIEGWETFHAFVHTRMNSDFGFYSSPIEMPHYELVFTDSGEAKLFRDDTGYMPRPIEDSPEPVARMLWEAYGVMMRMESEENLALRFADSGSMFARVQGADGKWRDEAMPIAPMRPYVESIAIAKADVAKAKDLPIVADLAINVDFALEQGVMTREERPRTVYRFSGTDAKTGVGYFDRRISLNADMGLKGLWESIAPQLIKRIIELGRVPAEIRVKSPRVYRMLRPICMNLPVKLSLHNRF